MSSIICEHKSMEQTLEDLTNENLRLKNENKHLTQQLAVFTTMVQNLYESMVLRPSSLSRSEKIRL